LADIIVATPRAIIGFPETGIGIYPGLGGTFRVARRTGKNLAKYLIGLGQMVNGKEALAIGLVDYCEAPENITPQWLASLAPRTSQPNDDNLPPKWKNFASWIGAHTLDELLEKPMTEEWQAKTQQKLRFKAPIGLRLAFELIEKAVGLGDDEASANELAHLTKIFNTEDALTGLKSVGKYKPQFKGK